mmetsp:Transcript_17045/g.33330  ORF Transcript_17045/g.33330 Transcript_17045/m.33330 type:complete len:363 (+) Transcript_17045:563-1651(+)|eukprot:CAMPEP_0171497918 /NCGR_PEP_ID=MMETSP0958-20121227/7548_1 /TAXON_ID=87120 /ORGANISM="Aurantiochytrium limacinum, Strain ATCCMYA-1381" /LENGTH=362 /DNA_ID=CAMNT_0012032233 /DNA_START=446 /DNA_END=1534 /DNA_ORIENTATION=-
MHVKLVSIWALLLLVSLVHESNAFFGGGRRRAPPKQEVEEIDLYEVLGLDEDATDKDIKSAYRKLSLKYHPDRNPDNEEAETKFREVSFAYEVLSSEEKRLLFDQGGLALVKEAEGEEDQGQGGGIFGGFFGNMQRGNRGPDYQMRLKVTLEELYNGAEKETRINRRVVCARCSQDNLSAKSKERCAKCGRCPNERRMVHRQMGGFLVQQEEEIPSKEKCKNEQKLLTAHIERGMQEGQEIRFKYMSEQQPKKIPGDVVFLLVQQKHRLFEREGDDLHMTMKITLKEALTGFVRSFKHLDDHEVEIDREGMITKPFETIVIPEEGMPLHEVPSQFGNLRVTFEVQFPHSLSEDQIEQIKKIL